MFQFAQVRLTWCDVKYLLKCKSNCMQSTFELGEVQNNFKKQQQHNDLHLWINKMYTFHTILVQELSANYISTKICHNNSYSKQNGTNNQQSS